MAATLLSLLVLGAGSDPLTTEAYLQPPKPVMDAVLAPWTENVTPGPISPDGSRYLIVERIAMASLSDMGRPHVNLGGFQVDTVAERERNLTTRGAKGLRVLWIKTKKDVRFDIPAGSKVSEPSWSPDGTRVAFVLNEPNATHLCVADPSTGRWAYAAKAPLRATLDSRYDWIGSMELAAVFCPAGCKAPVAPVVAVTPRIEVSDQQVHHIVTYPSLMSTPFEESQLEYFATGQLAIVDLAHRGAMTNIGRPTMISAVDVSPDGKYFRVTTLEKPFSYFFPTSSFGHRETIWDATGKELTELDKTPLNEGKTDPNATPAPGGGRGRVGAGGVAGGPPNLKPRGIEWRPDGAGLSLLQLGPASSDGPTPSRKDRVMLWVAPFGKDDKKVVYESDDPITSVRYSDDAKTIFLTQTVQGRSRLSLVRLSDGKPVTLTESGSAAPGTGAGGGRPGGGGRRGVGGGGNAGQLVSRAGSHGVSVVLMNSAGDAAYLEGTTTPRDPEAEAPRPWIDKISLTDGKRERIFESKPDFFEQASLLDVDAKTLLVSRQSAKDVPNSFAFDTSAKTEAKLTDNKDYLPDLTQARRERFTVTRADGIHFQVTVTFPEHVYGKMPAIFWFYPAEFESQDAYDRTLRNYNKNLFPTVSFSNRQIFARAGYLVVEPACPIVGPAGRMNDTYVSQLRNNLSAVIDELDKRGWIDRQKLAISGHSYGAFSTANAMIATPYFKAGIAGDGNYNRSLTPFGFQNEQRELWEGRDTYLQMSPILYVDQINGALLMYHGMEDQNVGTDPINSERMFAALTALGKPAELTMYPYEDHGQIARETVLDQWARWVAWLDEWVKNPASAKAVAPPPPADDGGG